MATIAQLEKQLATIQAALEEMKKQPPQGEEEIDWDEMVGRLVMVRDYSDDEWLGPVVYAGFDTGPTEYPHDTVIGGEYYYCKPYDGPTAINWQSDLTKCHIPEGCAVVVHTQDGGIGICDNEAVLASWNDGSFSKYAVIRL